MNDDTLPADKLGELGAAHRKSLDMREANRIKAGVLLAAGWAAEQVADILCADDKAVCNHLEHYRHGGVEALMHAANRSRPSPLSNDSRTRRTFLVPRFSVCCKNSSLGVSPRVNCEEVLPWSRSTL